MFAYTIHGAPTHESVEQMRQAMEQQIPNPLAHVFGSSAPPLADSPSRSTKPPPAGRAREAPAPPSALAGKPPSSRPSAPAPKEKRKPAAPSAAPKAPRAKPTPSSAATSTSASSIPTPKPKASAPAAKISKASSSSSPAPAKKAPSARAAAASSSSAASSTPKPARTSTSGCHSMSSSSSSSSSCSATFDVFLCHRGSDARRKEKVKEELAIPLYHYLTEASFNVFLDKFGLSLSIPSHGMLQALATCDKGVIFFSRGFIDGIFKGKAPWCLLELRVLQAKHHWSYFRNVEQKGISAATPQPRILAIAVPPFKIDDCWTSEFATKPLPMVTHADLKIEEFELDGLKKDLAAVSPRLLEFMEDPQLTLQKMLSRFPFIELADKDDASLTALFQDINRRLNSLRLAK